MNKEEALSEFLNGLRVAVNNSLAYSRQHPFFLKTSEDFKEKIDQAFNFLKTIKVDVAPESLFLDGKNWEKAVSSLELARLLHQRKVKSIEFEPGVSAEELADFLSFLSLQPKEIIKSGGLSVLLKKGNVRHIHSGDLDYSALLGSQGEDAKDAWLYLFKQAAGGDVRRALDFTDEFLKGVNSLNVKDIIEDGKLRDDLGAFLKQLKNSDKEKFSQSSQALSGLILSSTSQLNSEEVDKLKEVFASLDDNDFADVFFSQISDSKFNILNLGLFSRLAGEERSERIASSLANNPEAKAALKANHALAKRIKDLLSGSSEENLPATYRNALMALIRDISPVGNFTFDRRQLRANFRLITLDFLTQDQTPEELSLILKILDNGWGDLAKDKDFKFLKDLLMVLKQGKLKIPRELVDSLQRHILQIVENCIWESEVPEELGYLVDNLEKASAPADFYLDKIFEENKPTLFGIKLFLKLFPSSLGIFYARLKEKYTDIEFLSRIVKIVSQIDLPVCASVLKEIFSFGNDLIKIEVLRAMSPSVSLAPGFLLPMLKDKNRMLKKEALSALLKDEAVSHQAIDILLGIPSPWGMENRLILENIQLIEELDVRAARDYLVAFSKKRFFWNKALRDKAQGVLENWK